MKQQFDKTRLSSLARWPTGVTLLEAVTTYTTRDMVRARPTMEVDSEGFVEAWSSWNYSPKFLELQMPLLVCIAGAKLGQLNFRCAFALY